MNFIKAKLKKTSLLEKKTRLGNSILKSYFATLYEMFLRFLSIPIGIASKRTFAPSHQIGVGLFVPSSFNITLLI